MLINFIEQMLKEFNQNTMAKITKLHKAIINRDSCSFDDADELVQNMILEVEDGRDPESVLDDEGFEPDYFFDILPFNF